jgi:4-aminobutyrate aminotransferase-like enzyme
MRPTVVDEYELICDVRGRGLIQGIELVGDRVRAKSITRQRSLSEPSSAFELDRVVTTIDRCASSQCM